MAQRESPSGERTLSLGARPDAHASRSACACQLRAARPRAAGRRRRAAAAAASCLRPPGFSPAPSNSATAAGPTPLQYAATRWLNTCARMTAPPLGPSCCLGSTPSRSELPCACTVSAARHRTDSPAHLSPCPAAAPWLQEGSELMDGVVVGKFLGAGMQVGRWRAGCCLVAARASASHQP